MRPVGLKYFFISFLTFLGIKTEKESIITPGMWRGILEISTTDELPFTFEVVQQKKQLLMKIYNAEEIITVTEIAASGDSVIVKMPIFDSEFHLKMENSTTLRGYWWNKARKTQNKIPFTAYFAEYHRFDILNEYYGGEKVDGKWEVHFSEDKPEDASPAIAEFTQYGNQVTGTFLTETGDYRYLEGVMNETDGLKLSCFDGAHAFLFTANLDENNQLNGKFYSGMHWTETWTAKRNPSFQLRSPDSLTVLKEGYDKLAFTFPNLSGEKVSLSDKKYQGKVVIVQLMGSWCPNCMDETRLFTEWHKRYRSQGLEVIALSYERSEVFADAVKAVSRLKTYFGSDYEFLIAGISNKAKASETLPMLNAVSAFPTAIFIDRNGNIQKIHTGFSGPGTGTHYTEFVTETEAMLKQMLK